MALTGGEISKLNRIIKLAEQLINKHGARSADEHQGKLNSNGKKTRIRRTGRELIAFRKMLKAERRKGVPVAVLARQHGVSSAYIYLLP